MPGFPLDRPDGLPIDGLHTVELLEPGDVLSRVFNHVDAAMKGFSALSWNPSRHPIGSVGTAGRFDLLPGCGKGGYLYGAQSDMTSEQVAIVETFRTAMLKSRDPSRSNHRVMSIGFRNARSLQRFTITQPVALVCIRTQRSREPFRMEEEVQQSADRDGTREWGEYIRKQVSDAAGIAYNSTTETSRLGLCSFVLWEDRVPSDIFSPTETIPLGQPKGRRLVQNALMDYNVLWN